MIQQFIIISLSNYYNFSEIAMDEQQTQKKKRWRVECACANCALGGTGKSTLVIISLLLPLIVDDDDGKNKIE